MMHGQTKIKPSLNLEHILDISSNIVKEKLITFLSFIPESLIKHLISYTLVLDLPFYGNINSDPEYVGH